MNSIEKKGAMHKHHNKIAYLDDPQRNGGLTAEGLLDQLPIEQHHQVLDFGAGTGYFTLPLATRLNGKVFALDRDPVMLERIQEKARAASVGNIELLSDELDDAELREQSLDRILASLVLHEISLLQPLLATMHRLLKADGQLVAIELEPKTGGGPKAPRLTSSGLEQQLSQAGFKVLKKFFPTESLYVIVARK